MRLGPERETLLYMLVALYATWFMWYAGWPRYGELLEDSEKEHFRKEFQGGRFDDDVFAGDLQNFIDEDDGKPLTLTIMMKYRESLDYSSKLPEGFVKAETVNDALIAFNKGFWSTALGYATWPVMVEDYQGHLYRPVSYSEDEDEDEDSMPATPTQESWSQMAMIRFRSRRDLLQIAEALRAEGVFHHRMAAVERISATVSTGARSSAYFLFPLLTLDFIMQCFVLFWFIFVFLLSEAVFPGPAPLKPEPKKKKVVKKKDKDDKKGDSLTKPTKPKAASSAEE